MKKLLGISLVAILTAAPMMAMAGVGDTVAGDPGATASGAASATNPPKYALAKETANDGKVATAGYVKGAYNAAIKAVNKLEDTKQNVISDLETIRSNASAGANALQKADITEGTTNGAITVKGTAVPVHGLGSAAYTASTAYASAAQGALADTALQTAGNGLASSGTTVSADLTDKGGLEFAGSTDGSKTISVKVDGTTVEKNSTSGALQVKDGSIGTAKLASGVVTSLGKADSALQPTSALNGANLTAGTVAKTALASGVQTSLGLADSAVQSVAEGSTNGTIKVDGNAVAVHGLGSAAYTASTDYATAAQGALAASAVQSVAEGSTNGTVSVDGTDVPVHGLGTAAYTASTAYESAGAVNTAIQALDATVTQTAGTDGLALSVTETNGVITAVSGSIADGTYVKPGDLSQYATQTGVVATIKSTPVSSQLNSNAVTGTIATVTDWTNETAGTAALVNGQLTDTTVTTTLDPQGQLSYHSSWNGK